MVEGSPPPRFGGLALDEDGVGTVGETVAGGLGMAVGALGGVTVVVVVSFGGGPAWAPPHAAATIPTESATESATARLTAAFAVRQNGHALSRTTTWRSHARQGSRRSLMNAW